ncbi:MAG: GAF domain-containing protein [Myxococcales bacterium]|nr:GAF domain-containing protein [Myxococcales bacterium]
MPARETPDGTENAGADAALLAALSESLTSFLESGDHGGSLKFLLRHVLVRTASEYGFIGAWIPGRALRVLAHEGIVWDAVENRAFYETAMQRYREQGYLDFDKFGNLFGEVLRTRRSVISNDRANDPRSGGIPPGHPPLTTFLGVPILRGTEIVGVIGVANRQGGYSGAEERAIQALVRQAAVLCDSYLQRRRAVELEDEFRQAQKLEGIGRLAGGVAHDFNNLLTAILSGVEFLETEGGDAASRASDLADIRAAAERARDLTRQLLAFARRQVLEPRVLDINQVVSGAERLLRRLLPENVTLDARPDPNAWQLSADPSQLEQVLVNLALNARDAMPGGGSLRFETHNVTVDVADAERHVGVDPGDYVVLSVVDSGEGMSKEVLSHLFEPFFTTKSVGKGTGLGLAMVHGVVHQSGGHIRVESEPGEGTAFHVYLPRAMGAVEPARPEPRSSRRGRENVLLVEDDQAVRLVTARALGLAGYRVTQAGSPAEALALLEGAPELDLLIADLVMPGGSGVQVAEAFLVRYPRLRVLYVSGHAGQVLDGLIGTGKAPEFLPKPYTPTVLLEKVRAVLDAS